MCIAIFYIALFVRGLDCYQTSRSDRTGAITSLSGGWGSWGETRYCDDGEYAIGIKLKVEGRQGSGDDTAANSFKLLCGVYGESTITETIFPSNGQQWGDWSENVLCSTDNQIGNHIKGFKSKVESSQGGGDDTALNTIEIKCDDGSTNQPSNGGPWGDWGSLDECEPGSGVCGFKLRVESKQGGGDDTALNAIRLQCCSYTEPTPTPTAAPTIAIGDCINVVGSYWAEDYQSEAECPSLYPVMTSCGIESSGADNNDGTSIQTSLGWCVAHAAHGSSGWVKAHARCCKLDESITCQSVTNSVTNSFNNLFTTISCPSNEYLTGCSSKSHWDNIDGSFPDILNLPSIDKSTSFIPFTNNDCNGKNEINTSGVNANAQCCKYTDSTRALQCGRIWGDVSGNNEGDISIAICPTEYFMSGCSGYSDDASTKSWYINDNNQCISVNKIGGGVGTYAVGICCKEVIVPQ